MFCHHVAYPLHFSYYGPGTVPSVEDTIYLFGVGSFTTDAEIEEMIGPVKRTDLMGATARGVGAYLRLAYEAEDFSSLPERLSDLIRRAA